MVVAVNVAQGFGEYGADLAAGADDQNIVLFHACMVRAVV